MRPAHQERTAKCELTSLAHPPVGHISLSSSSDGSDNCLFQTEDSDERKKCGPELIKHPDTTTHKQTLSGRYLEVARGAFGIVLMMEGNRVLKVPRTINYKEMHSLRREIQVIQNLPETIKIAPFFCIGSGTNLSDGTPVIIMPLLMPVLIDYPNKQLGIHPLLGSNNPDWIVAFKAFEGFFSQVLQALNDANIRHHDIKPENLLFCQTRTHDDSTPLSEPGDSFQFKLTDFDLCRASGSTVEAIRYLGTYDYNPFEFACPPLPLANAIEVGSDEFAAFLCITDLAMIFNHFPIKDMGGARDLVGREGISLYSAPPVNYLTEIMTKFKIRNPQVSDEVTRMLKWIEPLTMLINDTVPQSQRTADLISYFTKVIMLHVQIWGSKTATKITTLSLNFDMGTHDKKVKVKLKDARHGIRNVRIIKNSIVTLFNGRPPESVRFLGISERRLSKGDAGFGFSADVLQTIPEEKEKEEKEEKDNNEIPLRQGCSMSGCGCVIV